MTVAELKRQAQQTKTNLENLRGQLEALEQAPTPDELTAAINQAAAIRTARQLIQERERTLAEQEAAVKEAEAAEAREKARAALKKRSEKAVERYGDSVMAVIGALTELQAVNEESIATGNGVVVAGLAMIKVPPRVVPSPHGNFYHVVSG